MKFIEYEKKKRIGLITLSRPEKRNAFNEGMVEELRKVFSDAGKDPEVKIILLKARGSAFSAGADLAYLEQLQKNTYEENLIDSRNLMDLFYQIYTHPRLVIAQVEGPAIAGGCGLTTVCDLCYATPEAVFGYSEVKIGFLPALVSLFLSRKIGESRARKYLLTGRMIPAAEAAASALITDVLPKDTIAEKVWEKALKLAEQTSAAAISQTKKLLANTANLSLEEGLQLAAEYNAKARGTTDCRAGIRSFLAKEKIKW